MHRRGFREAARLPCQTVNPGPQRQRFALTLLGIAFARAGHLSVQMPRVRAPMIRMKTGEPEGLQQRLQLQNDLIFASSEHLRQALAGVVLNGVPQPSLVLLFPDNAPHFIHLSPGSRSQVELADLCLGSDC